MKKLLRGLRNALGKGLYATFVALVTVSFVTGTLAIANYAVTVGSGTNFGSIVVSSVHYAQQLICDLTTPSQCAAVSAAGAVKVDNSGVTQPVSGTITANAGTNLNTSALATSANQSTEIASLATIATNTGTTLAGVTTAQTSAAASSLVAKASAGSVVSISGSAASGSYIMLFNATTAPADGAVTPLKCWGPMAAAGPFVFSWGVGPVLAMSTGATVVSSSTGCFTKTAVNAPFISVEYQ